MSERTKNTDDGKKTLEVGTIRSACMRYIHPSKEIREKYGGTAIEKNKLHGIRIVGRSMMRLCSHGKEVRTYLLCHDDFGEVELHCAISNFKVTQE